MTAHSDHPDPQQGGEIEEVVAVFFDSCQNITILPLQQGNINDTYLVDVCGQKAILQRINRKVFPQPQSVAENSARISQYFQSRSEGDKRGRFPRILPTRNGDNYHRDRRGNVWRAQSYIDNSMVYDRLHTLEGARQVGICLGRFHGLLREFPLDLLKTTLPDFHNLPAYLEKYDKALADYDGDLSAELQGCFDCVDLCRVDTGLLEQGKKAGELTVSIIHGDPKVANILFDMTSNEAISLIDLDTVGPGLLLYDIGDCLRSCCCSMAENEYGKTPVRCNVDMVTAVLEGYFREKRLAQKDKDAIFSSLYLITFELGLRFLTDYLQGNCYFKIVDDDDNLHRALLQFQLVTSIRQQRRLIEECVDQAEKTARKNEGIINE